MTDAPEPATDDDNLVRHAITELRMAGMFDDDADYGPEFADHIVDIVRTFSSGEHSGGSAGLAVAILARLLRFEALTPITPDPETWYHVAGPPDGPWYDEDGVWQSNRQPDCFSNNGGKTWYFLSRSPLVGEHVYHHPSGDHLGVVTEVTEALVHFNGSRTRDGNPVTFGGHDEVRIGPEPVAAGVQS